MKKITILASILFILFAACAAPQPSPRTPTPETPNTIPSETSPAHPTQTLTPIPTETLTQGPTQTPTELPGELTLVTLADAILIDKQMDKYPELFTNPQTESSYTKHVDSSFLDEEFIYDWVGIEDDIKGQIYLASYLEIEAAERTVGQLEEAIIDSEVEMLPLSYFEHDPSLPPNTWIQVLKHETSIFSIRASHNNIVISVMLHNPHADKDENIAILNYILASLISNLIELGY